MRTKKLTGGVKPAARMYYLDYLRIISTFFVVFLHVSASKILEVPIASNAWLVFVGYDSFSRFVVPMFAMISGALFLNPDRTVKIKNLYLKNILRIATAYIVWSTSYAIYYNRQWGTDAVVKAAIKGHYHMWFLLMLIGVYAIVPILRKIVEDKKTLRYYLVIAGVFTFVLPLVMKIANSPTFSEAYGKMNFHFTIGYSAYFVLGYFLASTDFTKLGKWICYILGVLGLAAIFALTVYSSVKTGLNDLSWWDNFSPFIMLMSVALFVFAKYEMSKIKVGKVFGKIVSELSKCSFGVYLFHAYVLERVGFYGLNVLSFNAVLSVPAIALFVFAVSFVISFAINKIPFISKYLV